MQHVRHIFITIKEFRQIRNLITIHTLAFQSQGIVNISYRIVIQVTLSYTPIPPSPLHLHPILAIIRLRTITLMLQRHNRTINAFDIRPRLVPRF